MTARGWSFLLAAGLFYLFANQTQVGWVYVLSALLAVLVLVAWLLNRAVFRRLHATRTLTPAELREGDSVAITLTLSAASLPQLRAIEICPLADPQGEQQTLRLYLPLLRGSTTFQYSVEVYRRGLHLFPPQLWQTRAPFGFFQRTRSVAVAGTNAVLVLPYLTPLTTLALLDSQPNATQQSVRSGVGTEVIGVRPYRTGDSPRHIHWRSVARTGVLVSREFADETQPALTLVLDRSAPYDNALHKHTPFEMGVRVATSVLDYALQRRISAFISADSTAMAYPMGALTWDAAQQYLARVPVQTDLTLAAHLVRLSVQAMAFVVVAWPTPEVLGPLLALHTRGIRLQVALMDAASFPLAVAAPSVASLAGSLRARGVACVIVRHDEAWPAGLG